MLQNRERECAFRYLACWQGSGNIRKLLWKALYGMVDANADNNFVSMLRCHLFAQNTAHLFAVNENIVYPFYLCIYAALIYSFANGTGSANGILNVAILRN